MLIKTRHFGEVDIADDRILTFDNGILGFEDHKQYTLLYDSTEGERPPVSWLQCCDIPELAIPVISPLGIAEDYNPDVEDELLKPLGELTDENIVLLTTLTVPADVKKMSINLRAPIIINSDNRKGAQIIVENQDFPIKYAIYDILQAKKEGRA